MALDTGTGVTIALATGMGGASVANVRSLTMPQYVVDEIDTTALGTTNYKTTIAADLVDPGEITAEILFDNVLTAAISIPSLGAADVVTVTWPTSVSGNTTPAKLVADVFIKSVKFPDFNVGALQMATVVFRLNGSDTEPAYNAESA